MTHKTKKKTRVDSRWLQGSTYCFDQAFLVESPTSAACHVRRQLDVLWLEVGAQLSPITYPASHHQPHHNGQDFVELVAVSRRVFGRKDFILE